MFQEALETYVRLEKDLIGSTNLLYGHMKRMLPEVSNIRHRRQFFCFMTDLAAWMFGGSSRADLNRIKKVIITIETESSRLAKKQNVFMQHLQTIQVKQNEQLDQVRIAVGQVHNFTGELHKSMQQLTINDNQIHALIMLKLDYEKKLRGLTDFLRGQLSVELIDPIERASPSTKTANTTFQRLFPGT